MSVSYSPPAVAADVVALSMGLGTGVAHGGFLSVGTPNTSFSISAGVGYILDGVHDGTPHAHTVTWADKDNIAATNIAAANISWVSIDHDGVVVQRVTHPTAQQRRHEISLGVLVHVNRVNLDTVNNEQIPSTNSNQQAIDLMASLGFFNVSGNQVSSNGANLNVDKSAGVMFAHGANYVNDYHDPHRLSLASLSAASFQYRFQDGTNGVTGAAVDPDIKDVAGVSTAVGTNKFTVQRFYSFTSNNLKAQPGQQEFNSLALAEESISATPSVFVTEPSIEANGLLRGFLIVQEGATDLSVAASAKFISALRFGTKDYT